MPPSAAMEKESVIPDYGHSEMQSSVLRGNGNAKASSTAAFNATSRPSAARNAAAGASAPEPKLRVRRGPIALTSGSAPTQYRAASSVLEFKGVQARHWSG